MDAYGCDQLTLPTKSPATMLNGGRCRSLAASLSPVALRRALLPSTCRSCRWGKAASAGPASAGRTASAMSESAGRSGGGDAKAASGKAASMSSVVKMRVVQVKKSIAMRARHSNDDVNGHERLYKKCPFSRESSRSSVGVVSIDCLKDEQWELIESSWRDANLRIAPRTVGLCIMTCLVQKRKANEMFAGIGPESTVADIQCHPELVARSARVQRFLQTCIDAIGRKDEATLSRVCEEMGRKHYQRGVNFHADDGWTHYKNAILDSVAPLHSERPLAANLSDPVFRAWSTLFMVMVRYIKQGFLACTKASSLSLSIH